MQRYNPKEIEPRWTKYWDEHQTYLADLNSSKPKYIAMSMFNYPSGAGIHIGHAMNYTISDVLARFKRQTGHESYHPVGWDSFGLPAENYAIKAGVSPQQSMATIIPNYHKQYKAMGWSNDWSKEIATHEPIYYKWTQWIFSQMFRNGLAYQDSRMQWWCTIDKSVLANEQVIDGKCWRHGGPNDPPVIQKEVKQWFFKITDYAEELLNVIDDLDWTESVKLAQKNWIGKSVGAEIDFKVDGTEDRITVFTTRADTIFSAAFIVLAPEHPLVEKVTAASQKELVQKYVNESLKKSDVERQADKEKTGVFTGSYAINPANDERIPIWVGDFVIGSYGTGAVFGDIHDDRDFEFLNKFNIPAKPTVIPEDKALAQKVIAKEFPYTGEGILIDSGEFTGLRSEVARDKIVKWLASSEAEGEPLFINREGPDAVREGEPFVERKAILAIVKHWSEDKYIGLKWKQVDWETLITGGIEEGQTAEEAAIAEIQEETGYQHPKLVKTLSPTQAKFFHVPKNENRHAYFTTMYFELADDSREEISDSEQAKHEVVWMSKEQMESFRLPESQRYSWNELMSRSTGGVAREKVNYRMRDWSVSRQRYWGAPIPIIYCPDHGAVLVPDKDLPVILPEIKDYAPTGDGRSALARASDWVKAPCPTCGKEGQRETDTLDTYICSSWYMLRYFDPKNEQKIFDSDIINKWMPIDFYNGADHATAHMIYARFVTRFFAKQGLVKEPEPFKRFLFNGKVTANDGQMFSKTLGNGIDPLEIIDSGYGADALRTYLMFAAPLELWARWDPQGVPGTHRFLNRIWTLVQEFLEPVNSQQSTVNSQQVLQVTHRAIQKVSDDIENLKYNTAIAALMQLTNDLYKLKTKGFDDRASWQFALESLVMMVAPFAPFIAEELWHQLGHQDSVHIDHWPVHDPKYLVDEKVTIVVQVNGKLRANIQAAKDASQEDLVQLARAEANVTKHLAGQEPKKTIVILNKLVNFVI